MGIAHICIRCGLDLARVPARLEPHYGLPLVVCPRCSHPCVRRRDPLAHRWRQGMRVAKSVGAAIGHAFVLFVLLMLHLVAISRLTEAWFDYWPSDLLAEHRLLLASCLLGVPLALGAWFASGLNHVSRWRLWIWWIILAAFFASLDVIFELIGILFDVPGYEIHHLPYREWIARIAALLLTMLIAPAGFKVGAMIRRAHRLHRSHHWRRRRRRVARSRRGST